MLRLCVAAAVASALLAAGALAASPRQQQYSKPAVAPPTTLPAATLPAHHVVATTTHTGGTLPFTGAELGTAVALGAVLVAAGFAARRLGSDRKD